jgi:hypothetical protein
MRRKKRKVSACFQGHFLDAVPVQPVNACRQEPPGAQILRRTSLYEPLALRISPFATSPRNSLLARF